MIASRVVAPAYDVAGVVDAIGTRVTELAVGMRVHARTKDPNHGACAESTRSTA